MELEVLVTFTMSIFRDLRFVGELQPLSENSYSMSHDYVNFTTNLGRFYSFIVWEDFPINWCYYFRH